MLSLITQLTLTIFLLLAISVAANAQTVEPPRIVNGGVNSALIGKRLQYTVVLPTDYYESPTTRYPVLYLLHGLFGHYSDWTSRTNVADYAAKYRMIIVAPEGNDSWYVDSPVVATDKYESYIIRELIPEINIYYRTINDRRDRGIAGLSMGGYGALKFAIKYPGTFAFAASMSGALDPVVRNDKNPKFSWDIFRPSIMAAFGKADSQTRVANDLHKLYRDLPANQIAGLPYLYFDCGLDDPWLGTNQDLAKLLAERHIPHEYRQLPGNHNWSQWDQQVIEVLRLAATKMPLRELHRP